MDFITINLFLTINKDITYTSEKSQEFSNENTRGMNTEVSSGTHIIKRSLQFKPSYQTIIWYITPVYVYKISPKHRNVCFASLNKYCIYFTRLLKVWEPCVKMLNSFFLEGVTLRSTKNGNIESII
jgi:hypothetical protein